MGSYSLPTELAAKFAWTPSPRGPLPSGEDRDPQVMEEVAAAPNNGRTATRGRYRTRGKAAAPPAPPPPPPLPAHILKSGLGLS